MEPPIFFLHRLGKRVGNVLNLIGGLCAGPVLTAAFLGRRRAMQNSSISGTGTELGVVIFRWG